MRAPASRQPQASDKYLYSANFKVAVILKLTIILAPQSHSLFYNSICKNSSIQPNAPGRKHETRVSKKILQNL